MSEIITSYIEKLKLVRDRMPQLIAEVLEENKTLIEDMNIAQLDEGKTSDGKYLPDYVPDSDSIYAPGPVKLDKTGAWRRGIYLKVSGMTAELDSTDDKNRILKSVWGDDILGVPDDKIETVINEILLPQLYIKIQAL